MATKNKTDGNSMLKRAFFVIKSVLIIYFVFLFSSATFAESDNSQKRVQRIALPSSYTVRLNDGFHDMELAPGFRDMNFGDTAEKLGPHAKLLSTLENGSRKLYTRSSDKLKAGNVPLRVIVYEFKKKLLTTIYLYSNLNNLEAIRNLCSSKYGESVQMKDETNGKDQYVWLTGTGLISLSQTELGAQLAISDLSVQLLADSDLREDEIVLLPGFRHMRIGHPFRSYADKLKAVWENGYGDGTYIRTEENLDIANCKVDSIEYQFTKQILTMITVKGNKECFEDLADICIIRYGKPDEAFVIEEGDFHSLRYSWKLGITEILLSKEEDSATLMIYSIPLMKAAAERNAQK
ncbi:MAG: hypothetical protein IJ601_08515 [Acidaminococcaceae bacterium]|nr:hypothetical protein [Acidaminococcaceae bacterium]